MTDNQTSPRPGVGVAVIVWREGQVLFYERRGAHGHGTWSVPGGHLEYGESWEECGAREVKEEVGIAIKNIHFLAVTNDVFDNDGKHYVSIWLEADWESGEPRSMEPHKVIGVAWHPLTKLPSPLFEPCWTNLRAIKPELFV